MSSGFSNILSVLKAEHDLAKPNRTGLLVDLMAGTDVVDGIALDVFHDAFQLVDRGAAHPLESAADLRPELGEGTARGTPGNSALALFLSFRSWTRRIRKIVTKDSLASLVNILKTQ